MESRSNNFYKSIIFIFIIIFFSNCSFSQTLDDIRSKLKIKNKSKSTQSKKNKFEIKNIRLSKISGWKTKSSKGIDENIFGVELTLKINKKGKQIPVPYNLCYFFDDEYFLLDRISANFLYNGKWKEVESDVLVLRGKQLKKIAFGMGRSFRFKYAVCVVGDQSGVDVAVYPKSAELSKFEFDEKKLYYNK